MQDSPNSLITYSVCDNHMLEIRMLYGYHNLPIPVDFPSIGFISYTLNCHPVAAGFLRTVEGNLGIIDSYITNPNIDSKTRHLALNTITDYIFRYCRSSHIEGLAVFTSSEGIIERCLNNGFSVSKDVMLYRKFC